MKRALKLIALLLALAIIATIAWFANGLLGNPISRYLAEKTAKEHLAAHYSGTDFYIERIGYDFKATGYYAHVKSPSSIDSSFTIAMNMDGTLSYDSYESRVLSGSNTYSRLWSAYNEQVDAVLEADDFPYPVEMSGGVLVMAHTEEVGQPHIPEFAMRIDELELDKEYDLQELGAKVGRVSVYIMSDSITHELAADAALTIKKAMDDAGVSFYCLDLVLWHPKPEDGSKWNEERIDLIDFLYDDIYEEGLIERVAQADAEAKAYYAAMDAQKEAEISK